MHLKILSLQHGVFGALDERLTAVLRVSGLIPALNKYLYGLQVVVLYVAVWVCELKWL